MFGRRGGPYPRLREAEQVARRPTGRTRVLGALSGGTVLAVSGAELARIWYLGTLPRGRGYTPTHSRPVEALLVLRDGYAVSRTRENALFNMLASFAAAFAITRGITNIIRTRGGIGFIRDVTVGDRHIHHFIPGGILSLIAGGVAIGTKNQELDKYLAFPFGVGVGLVLDESALLLELEDVYWTEEGVLSVQIAFAAMGLLAATAYLIQMLRRNRGEESTEADWETAARAWDDLQLIPGDLGIDGIEGLA